MDIGNFLAEGNYTMLNKPLAKKIGISQAVFLCELISQRKRFKKEEFYFTQADMEKELGLSENTQLRYSKELKEKGLINVEKKGIPGRNRYTINDDKIHNIIMGETCTANLAELEPPEGWDYSNKKETKKEKEKESEKNSGTTELVVRLKDYQLSPDIINLIHEFDKCKKGQKISKMSDTQLKKWVNKLKNLGLDNDEGMKRVIENSMVNGWQGIFELKGEDKKIAESSKEPKTENDYIELYHKYYLEYKEKELKEKWGDDKYYYIRRKWLEWCASK